MKCKLINTNSGIATVTLANGSSVRIAPGEKNALPLGDIPDAQVVGYRALSRVGVLLRVEKPNQPTEPEEPNQPTEPEEPNLTAEQIKVREEFLKGRGVDELENSEIKALYEAMGLPTPRPTNRPACEEAIRGE